MEIASPHLSMSGLARCSARSHFANFYGRLGNLGAAITKYHLALEPDKTRFSNQISGPGILVNPIGEAQPHVLPKLKHPSETTRFLKASCVGFSFYVASNRVLRLWSDLFFLSQTPNDKAQYIYISIL